MAHSNAKSEVTLEIDSLSHGAYGIGRHEGQVIMVPGTVPGDRITARAIESRGSYAIGELSGIIAASPHRRVPPCPYVGTCGGCPWQQIDYRTQLAAKVQNLEDTLRRIGKLTHFEILPIIAAPLEFNYRRRIQLRCGPHREIGFSRSASHDLVAIDACAIAAQPINRALEQVRRCIKSTATHIADVEIVAGDQENELVLVARAAGPLAASDNATFDQLLSGRKNVKGVIVTVNGRRHVWGDPRITVVTEPGIELTVDADVFTQVNAEGNRTLLHHLLDAGEFTDHDRVLELYCGSGNFTLSIARRSREVVAVEGHRQAVENAKLNGQRHGLENIRWRTASVPAAVANLAQRRERFSKIVLDPPRAGAKGLDRDLASLNAEKILYVSCNPATLARDLSALTRLSYKLTPLQPVDLFPQTFHLETLAILEQG
jgi:23S rRNA (uracil1939-C5)-methyltransferase